MMQSVMRIFWIVSTLFVLAAFQPVLATHLRAGEIIVRRDLCNNLKFFITVRVYVDTESPVQFGGESGQTFDVLNFGDGKDVFYIPTQTSTPLADFPNVGIAEFTKEYTYGGPGRYVISYREPNRNANVLNMINSVETTFYIETQINIDPALTCNEHTPELRIPPIDRGCIGVQFQHNPGATDADGDSLSYELVVPFQSRNQPVNGYQDPNLPAFYAGNYNTANENQNGPPTFSIDPITGTITWDAPGVAGEFNIAFIVIEWREPAFGPKEKVRIGYVRRDMQIIIAEDCNNERPDLILPEDVCVVAGTTLTATIKGFDLPNSLGVRNNVKIEAFSDIFEVNDYNPNPATVTNENIFLPGTEVDPLEMEFEWKTTCLAVKDQPYQIVFKITDNGSPRLVTFKTWFVTVIGPPPVLQSAVANQVTRKATLTWDSYACTNASQLQIWRRVDSFMYTPGECETGIPESLGYEQIAVVPSSTTSFTDPGPLTEGAVYCYRIVANFPEPRAGESIMSNEVCTDPIEAAAPIITKVSVLKTSTTDGEVRISWVEPLDPVYTPTYGVFPFYDYKVWRSNSTTGALPWTEVHSGTINDTTVVDNGINTKDQTFSYRVVLYAKPAPIAAPAPADTSAAASMVRLEIQSGLNRLDLRWSAFVPWSNLSQLYPFHDVYKGPAGADESAGLVFLQAVNVTEEGFVYPDLGLSDTDEFCYRIMTRGTYGNPAIGEPLKNFSQVQCAQPSDIEPPLCAPVIQIANLKTCEEYLADEGNCGASQFANELRWNRPTECGDDIIGYRVYASFTKNGTYQLLNLPNSLPTGLTYTRDTFFIDNGLTSFARCYKITAIDRSGNESVQSTSVCNDNCPYYELPNAFTPNGDGCNDFFSAYNDRSNGGEEGDGCSLADPAKCARFVDKVVFKVYNRWGNEVYEYESVRGSEDKTIFIDWDGRDKNNGELTTGFYFYVAEVTFQTVDPRKRNQSFKSWVHLIR